MTVTTTTDIVSLKSFPTIVNGEMAWYKFITECVMLGYNQIV